MRGRDAPYTPGHRGSATWSQPQQGPQSTPWAGHPTGSPREGSVCLQACVCELTRTHRHALLCASADPHVHMPSAATQPLNKHCSGPACPGRPERQSLKASQVPLRLKGRCEGQRGSQEIDPVLAQRKVMTNLDSIFKSRDITLPTKFRLVKAMVFPVVMYGGESWTVKKAEHRRIDAYELWCWRRLLRVPWTARTSNQSILKEISPGCSLEGMMLKLKLQYFGHLMRRVDSLEDSDAGRDWGQEEKGTTEDEMAGWHH